MRPAVGYIRVSTADQASEGVSLAAQRYKIKMWATLNDFELLAVEEDDISGKSAANRPGLQRALKLACQHHAAVVVYSLSRLARSTKDAIEISERLNKCGADLVSLTESIDTTSAAGKMVFKMLAVLAEFERDTIAERTKAAMAFKRANGQRISRHVPFGFDLSRDGVRLRPNTREQAALPLSMNRLARQSTAISTDMSQGAKDVGYSGLNLRSVRHGCRRSWTGRISKSRFNEPSCRS